MILERLIQEARERAQLLKESPPKGRMPRPSFQAALAGRSQLSLIAEFKRASPSQGGIALEADLEAQVLRYARAGASALSVLTEERHFGGSIEDLVRAAQTVELPILMKDFVVDPVQVRLAAQSGASAVLLIVRGLDGPQLRELFWACVGEGLEALVECHNALELARALELEGALIGLNNRDLDDFSVDRSRALQLLPRVPEHRVVVVESGFLEPEQTRPLRGLVDGVLVGSALMRAADPASFIKGVVS